MGWVVDCSDRSRLETCKEELSQLLLEERLDGATLLVMANKQDLPGAASVDEKKTPWTGRHNNPPLVDPRLLRRQGRVVFSQRTSEMAHWRCRFALLFARLVFFSSSSKYFIHFYFQIITENMICQSALYM